MIPFTTVKISENHIGIQLDAMDVLTDGELIKIDLTPVMVGGIYHGEHEEKGFKFSYTATDIGISPLCSFTFPFPDKTGIPYQMHAEIEVRDGTHKWRFDYNEGVSGDCYWMSGGIFRLLQYQLHIHERILFEVPLPYVNGANFDLKVTPSATSSNPSAIESFLAILQ